MCCDVLRGMTVELVLEIGVLSVESTTGPVVGRLLYHLYMYLNVKERQLFLKWKFLLFHQRNSASDNEIAKYRYLPCIQHQNQTAVTSGWQAATRNVRQPPFLKSQS